MKSILQLTILFYCISPAISQNKLPKVNIIGAMKSVMWKGELEGKIDLDTITSKEHLFGLGPQEYLNAELMIIEGKSYKSSVINDKQMKIEESFHSKAPFFVYSTIENFESIILPDSIQTIKDLEQYIIANKDYQDEVFMFRMEGEIENATIHIVNLAKGSKVSSPTEAHKGQVNYKLKKEKFDIVGFYSKNHQSILTHHDTFLHLHLITKDRKKMGHLDEVKFKDGTIKIYLPIN